MTLQALKDRADAAGRELDDACRPHYCDGRWGAYRAIEWGQPVPSGVMAAFDAYHAATQAYYLARDGKAGLLGRREA